MRLLVNLISIIATHSIAAQTCPKGKFLSRNDECRLCPAGRYGDTVGLQKSDCSGLCERGYYCPAGSTSRKSYKCPAGRYGDRLGLQSSNCSGECEEGYFCPNGSTSPRQHPCGVVGKDEDKVFCPAASEKPTPVLAGYYSGPIGYGPDGILLATNTTRHFQTQCEEGFYCKFGLRHPCPPGRYDSSKGETNELCSGQTQPGFYSLSNSIVPEPCPAGRFGETAELGTALCTATCPKGHYCPSGSATPTKCPSGRFGSSTGLTTSSCSHNCLDDDTCVESKCAPGFYCPLGSTSQRQQRCGRADVFCPAGSSVPLPVQRGYYSLPLNGTDTMIRSICLEALPLSPWREQKRFLHPLATFPLTVDLGPAFSVYSTSYAESSTGGINHIIKQRYRPARVNESLTKMDCVSSCSDPTYDDERACVRADAIWTERRWLENQKSRDIAPEKTRSSQQPCPSGKYCVLGVQHDCPAGRWGKGGDSTPTYTEHQSKRYEIDSGARVMWILLGTLLDCKEHCARYDDCAGFSRYSSADANDQADCFGRSQTDTSNTLVDDIEWNAFIKDKACEDDCDAGHFCPAGSSSQVEKKCGDISLYCPRGSAEPLAVPDGFYSTDGHPNTRSTITPCEAGSYCTNGVKTPCEAGRYGKTTQLPNSFCTEACPSGHYCPRGTVTPIICPAGRYGDVEGHKDAQCSGPCLAGYYCEAGSTDGKQHECGSDDRYCPEGSSEPIEVSIGYYTTGDKNPPPVAIESLEKKKEVVKKNPTLEESNFQEDKASPPVTIESLEKKKEVVKKNPALVESNFTAIDSNSAAARNDLLNHMLAFGGVSPSYARNVGIAFSIEKHHRTNPLLLLRPRLEKQRKKSRTELLADETESIRKWEDRKKEIKLKRIHEQISKGDGLLNSKRVSRSRFNKPSQADVFLQETNQLQSKRLQEWKEDNEKDDMSINWAVKTILSGKESNNFRPEINDKLKSEWDKTIEETKGTTIQADLSNTRSKGGKIDKANINEKNVIKAYANKKKKDVESRTMSSTNVRRVIEQYKSPVEKEVKVESVPKLLLNKNESLVEKERFWLEKNRSSKRTKFYRKLEKESMKEENQNVENVDVEDEDVESEDIDLSDVPTVAIDSIDLLKPVEWSGSKNAEAKHEVVDNITPNRTNLKVVDKPILNTVKIILKQKENTQIKSKKINSLRKKLKRLTEEKDFKKNKYETMKKRQKLIDQAKRQRASTKIQALIRGKHARSEKQKQLD
eukprot:g489.t1